MSKSAALFALGALFSLAAAQEAVAETSHISIDTTSWSTSESFDSLGSAREAQLPIGWHMGATSIVALAKDHTEEAAGTTGLGSLTSNSQGKLYNFADGETLTSTDRSPGFLNDANTTQTKSLFIALTNNSGSAITELRLSYDIEKYRKGVSTDVSLQYGSDGQTWTNIADAAQHYATDGSTAVLNPPTSINKVVSLTGLSIPHQTNLYLRWIYSPSAAINSPAIGFDNVQLDIGPLQQLDLVWDGGAGATWDAVSSNWKNSSGEHVQWNDAMPNNAKFLDGGSGVATTVTVSSSRRAGNLTFDAGAKTYSLLGGSLELAGSGGIGITGRSNAIIQTNLQVRASQKWDVSSSLTVSGIFALDRGVKLTKIGAGSVTLSGQQIHGGNSQFEVSEGTLRLGANLGLPSRLTIVGNLNSTDATVILDADQSLSDLAISSSDSGHQGLNLSSPSAAGVFRSLRVYASDLAATKTSLYNMIAQARLTPGDGIYDTSLALHQNSAIGIAAINNFVLIRPTRMGDLNLDGVVTISDFIDLTSNFGRAGVTWQEGDLNFDGIVSIGDFIDLASNFGISYSGGSVAVLESDRQAIDAFAAAHGVVVPEPASVMVMLLASLATRRPRRVQFPK